MNADGGPRRHKLAAQTKDDWERELLQRITTQWLVLAIHKKGKEENTPEAN
jgi:hypothetical protein